MIGKIKAVLPAAAIVLIVPPDFNELPTACCPTARCLDAAREARAKLPADVGASRGTYLASAAECACHTPAKLAQIRDAQRDIAKRRGLIYWNWASIMPTGECGAHQWFTQSPPLMSRDHVHFTAEGYRKSAEQFLNTLIPVIERSRSGPMLF